jgi:hypothetical protein
VRLLCLRLGLVVWVLSLMVVVVSGLPHDEVHLNLDHLLLLELLFFFFLFFLFFLKSTHYN